MSASWGSQRPAACLAPGSHQTTSTLRRASAPADPPPLLPAPSSPPASLPRARNWRGWGWGEKPLPRLFCLGPTPNMCPAFTCETVLPKEQIPLDSTHSTCEPHLTTEPWHTPGHAPFPHLASGSPSPPHLTDPPSPQTEDCSTRQLRPRARQTS